MDVGPVGHRRLPLRALWCLVRVRRWPAMTPRRRRWLVPVDGLASARRMTRHWCDRGPGGWLGPERIGRSGPSQRVARKRRGKPLPVRPPIGRLPGGGWGSALASRAGTCGRAAACRRAAARRRDRGRRHRNAGRRRALPLLIGTSAAGGGGLTEGSNLVGPAGRRDHRLERHRILVASAVGTLAGLPGSAQPRAGRRQHVRPDRGRQALAVGGGLGAVAGDVVGTPAATVSARNAGASARRPWSVACPACQTRHSPCLAAPSRPATAAAPTSRPAAPAAVVDDAWSAVRCAWPGSRPVAAAATPPIDSSAASTAAAALTRASLLSTFALRGRGWGDLTARPRTRPAPPARRAAPPGWPGRSRRPAARPARHRQAGPPGDPADRPAAAPACPGRRPAAWPQGTQAVGACRRQERRRGASRYPPFRKAGRACQRG
jgi:hypothetical protein